MIFSQLWEAAQRGRLILVDGGMCRFNPRRDGVLTIIEIIVLPERQGAGIGSAILNQLIARDPVAIRAKCPADLAANAWYAAHKFKKVATEYSAKGALINVWERPVKKERLPCVIKRTS